MGKDKPKTDQCYYCHNWFPEDKIYAHESTCDKNPSMQRQDDD